jgi:polar amino acid transport system substrate-binding protein
VQYLRLLNVEVVELANVEEAVQALDEHEVEAVVYDAPVLLYYAAHEGKGRVSLVGSIFRKESYGIAFPLQSPHRKRVNEALLQLKENGTYDQLYRKWFGGAAT